MKGDISLRIEKGIVPTLPEREISADGSDQSSRILQVAAASTDRRKSLLQTDHNLFSAKAKSDDDLTSFRSNSSRNTCTAPRGVTNTKQNLSACSNTVTTQHHHSNNIQHSTAGQYLRSFLTGPR